MRSEFLSKNLFSGRYKRGVVALMFGAMLYVVATWCVPAVLAQPPMDQRSMGERSMGERSMGERPMGERPMGERPMGERSMGERPMSERPMGERPMGERSKGERPMGERPMGPEGRDHAQLRMEIMREIRAAYEEGFRNGVQFGVRVHAQNQIRNEYLRFHGPSPQGKGPKKGEFQRGPNGPKHGKVDFRGPGHKL